MNNEDKWWELILHRAYSATIGIVAVGVYLYWRDGPNEYSRWSRTGEQSSLTYSKNLN